MPRFGPEARKPPSFRFCRDEPLKTLNKIWKYKNPGTFSAVPLSKFQNLENCG
jgi:hypothetical protein